MAVKFISRYKTSRSIVDVSVINPSKIALTFIRDAALANSDEEAKELKMERCTPLLVAGLYLLTGDYLSLIRQLRLLSGIHIR